MTPSFTASTSRLYYSTTILGGTLSSDKATLNDSSLLQTTYIRKRITLESSLERAQQQKEDISPSNIVPHNSEHLQQEEKQFYENDENDLISTATYIMPTLSDLELDTHFFVERETKKNEVSTSAVTLQEQEGNHNIIQHDHLVDLGLPPKSIFDAISTIKDCKDFNTRRKRSDLMLKHLPYWIETISKQPPIIPGQSNDKIPDYSTELLPNELNELVDLLLEYGSILQFPTIEFQSIMNLLNLTKYDPYGIIIHSEFLMRYMYRNINTIT